MAVIKFDFDALAAQSSEISSKISALDYQYSRLMQLIDRIGASWQGAASEQYVILMKSYAKQILQYKKVLEEFKKYADTARAKFYEKDSNAAGRISGSF